METFIAALGLVSLLVSSSLQRDQQKPVIGSFETSDHRKVTYERFGAGIENRTLILLHGASGPAQEFYQQQARFFSAHGYNVLLPHYFDASRSPAPTEENYRLWEEAVESLIATLRPTASPTPSDVYIIGYSLGSSVALAVGSQDQSITAIADWYGSLPDSFFYRSQGMPPLLILHGERDRNIPVANARQLITLCEEKQLSCENRIYPDQGHGFDSATIKDADERTLAFFSRTSQQK